MQNIVFETESLRQWFRLNKRDLPWRNTQDPYAVLISEVMLQQTQVSVVIDYYLRWMERFPTITALAEASEEAVIKQWEGLGYYSRARNLHSAARYLVMHHNGQLPITREELTKVKGIGPYTMGALMSFAFHQKAAAVDGNTIRVLSRYFAIEEQVDRPFGNQLIWKIAEALLPEQAPWEIVEGLIELGATVCKKEPSCISCPLKRTCRAFELGMTKELPRKGKKTAISKLVRHVFIILYQQHLLLKIPSKQKLMAGLYEFPYVESPQSEFPFSLTVEKTQELDPVSHHFTRYQATLLPSVWKASEQLAFPGYEWIAMDEMTLYPLSAGHRRILQTLLTLRIE